MSGPAGVRREPWRGRPLIVAADERYAPGVLALQAITAAGAADAPTLLLLEADSLPAARDDLTVAEAGAPPEWTRLFASTLTYLDVGSTADGVRDRVAVADLRREAGLSDFFGRIADEAMRSDVTFLFVCRPAEFFFMSEFLYQRLFSTSYGWAPPPMGQTLLRLRVRALDFESPGGLRLRVLGWLSRTKRWLLRR